ncbi:MAG: PhoH family protein [Betaproteobacteria bacterium]|jgi:phosphate starvation-inducible PhoH-like protein|nr:PhoH family protein [Pseudomonadota bacterium]NBO94604.1 PhoH family protein [Betaproteobacteria bacterium]NBP34798.1 PhoH family protein [Betaproteobacteria bacterium]NBP37568.1 PhoH family protein [Betaproteobacteria bacterium]NBQ77705.1 PhoH family protein [Betaproteobacteria bacterium]
MTQRKSAARRWKPEPVDNRRLANLCGALDANLRHIESTLDVSIRRQQAVFLVKGFSQDADTAIVALQFFYARASRALEDDDIALGLISLREQDLPFAVAQPNALSGPESSAGHTDPAPGGKSFAGAPTSQQPGIVSTEAVAAQAEIRLQTKRSDLQPRTPNQRLYVQHILSHDLSFGIGPAGTGKTYLAVACAVDALEREQVKRIILTRPAVEAGERLGFLPGDLAQKVDPYLRPLYDALYDLMGFERVNRAMERQSIEIAPLAYMRGRTLNHAFIILDEAQNTTAEQMKMFLTRLGFGSRAVVTGDPTQIDLPKGSVSGLINARRILDQVKGIAFTEFDSSDVVRHPLVGRIVDAYERQARLEH